MHNREEQKVKLGNTKHSQTVAAAEKRRHREGVFVYLLTRMVQTSRERIGRYEYMWWVSELLYVPLGDCRALLLCPSLLESEEQICFLLFFSFCP